LKRGYAPRLAAGVVAAGGTLGVLIPPSGILVVYSIATQTSLVDLFLAALVPGIITALAYAAVVYGMVKLKPSLGGDRSEVATGGRLKALLSSWEIAILFLIVMGGIYLGIATPTESAAVGALVAALLVFRQKGNRYRMIRDGLLETGSATSSIFLLIIGAGLFSLGLATTQIPVELANWAVQFSDNRYIVLLLILLPFFVLGVFVDGISMLLLMLPIVYPVVVRLGFDPIWFGIVVTKTVEIGLLTPPVGLNAFVVRNVAPEIPLPEIFRGCMPFIIVEFLLVAALIFWPGMTQLLVPVK
jgi:C4-dicarboxylate transporter DctM subunit